MHAQEKPGWDKPDYVRVMEPRVDIWLGACVVRPPGGRLRCAADRGDRNRAARATCGKALRSQRPACLDLDSSQAENPCGLGSGSWWKVWVRGTILFSQLYVESLNADGTVEFRKGAACSALATDTYVLSGEGTETSGASFTYHGYRYVQAEGWPGRPDPQLPGSAAHVVRSPLPSRGRFSWADNALLCSPAFHQMVRRGVIFTVYPRLTRRAHGLLSRHGGSLGRTHLGILEAQLPDEVRSDIADAQLENGIVAMSPINRGIDRGLREHGPVRLTAQPYGDTRAMTRHYESMRRWYLPAVRGRPAQIQQLMEFSAVPGRGRRGLRKRGAKALRKDSRRAGIDRFPPAARSLFWPT